MRKCSGYHAVSCWNGGLGRLAPLVIKFILGGICFLGGSVDVSSAIDQQFYVIDAVVIETG